MTIKNKNGKVVSGLFGKIMPTTRECCERPDDQEYFEWNHEMDDGSIVRPGEKCLMFDLHAQLGRKVNGTGVTLWLPTDVKEITPEMIAEKEERMRQIDKQDPGKPWTWLKRKK